MKLPGDGRRRLEGLVARIQDWSRRHIPPGLRLVVGIVFIIGGLFAFLPILGLWMIPLGIAIAALDVAPIWRWFKGRK